MDPKVTPSPAPPSTSRFSREELKDILQEVLQSVQTGGSTANDAMRELVQAQQDLVAATQRTVRHSNSYTQGISPFSYPEGEEKRPKPKLDRETWWLGTRVEDSQATPAEIEAFNDITVSKIWRGDPKFGADVSAKRRFIMLPHTSIDERMALPANIPLAMRELNSGEDAIDPIKMEAEIRALKKQVASLATQVNPVAVADAAKPLEAAF